MAKVLDSQVSCLADMKDGDVAEILSWHSEDLRPGDVVQRYKDIIIPIDIEQVCVSAQLENDIY